MLKATQDQNAHLFILFRLTKYGVCSRVERTLMPPISSPGDSITPLRAQSLLEVGGSWKQAQLRCMLLHLVATRRLCVCFSPLERIPSEPLEMEAVKLVPVLPLPKRAAVLYFQLHARATKSVCGSCSGRRVELGSGQTTPFTAAVGPVPYLQRQAVGMKVRSGFSWRQAQTRDFQAQGAAQLQRRPTPKGTWRLLRPCQARRSPTVSKCQKLPNKALQVKSSQVATP